MTFTDAQIRIEPGHETRQWQSCTYYVGDVDLFHERTYVRSRPLSVRRQAPTPAEAHWLGSGPNMGDSTEQWFGGLGSKRIIEALAAKHGGHANEDFYPADPDRPEYFLSFNDTEKALAFCRTDDFDALCLTLAKLP
jgi:hypothetical protein